MSDCISTKELSQKSPNDSNQEKNFKNDIDPEFTKEPARLPGTNIDFLSQSEDNPSQIQDPDDDGEGCRSIMSEEGLNEEGAILLPGVDESTASKDETNFDLIGSTESGEVSEEEFHGGAASPEKRLDPLVSESVVDPENQEEFFDDDRSETPLQDEQENELCDKSSEFLDKNDGDLDYAMAGVCITNAALIMPPRQTEQNTDGELSEEGTSQGLVDECDIENEGELKRPSYDFAKESERKHAVTDDYGELDYEEEEADDCLDKGKPGEDKKRRDRLGSKDALTTKQEEGSNEPEDGKEVIGSKESKTEKKETESGEEGEEPEEGEEKQDGEGPEEGEKSTDGELDDDDDCEEGEIREPGQKHVFIRPMCRFYTRGNCTWGNNCRFLHPGINDKGNYSMIDQSFPPGPPAMMGPVMGPCIRGPLPPPPPGPPGPWIHERLGKRIMPHRPLEAEPEAPLASAPLPAPPTVGEAAASESAWERGLRNAKEIRKNAKRKETDPAFDDKKDADVEDDRQPAPAPAIPPPPPIANPLPPPRDPYYDDLPSNRYEDEGFYVRPSVPLPPPDAWPFRPPPMDPFEMRWMRPLEFPPPPPHHPDFRLSERERAMRDRRFSPPPRFGRFEPPFFRGGPAREPLPAPPTDILVRGRGEEWKDPWLRSRSPKRKRASSSRSGSRGRRRSRSRSRSYSSFSSSSGSSKSRSRSRSSSYSSSYSKSSHSRSSFSSRSSSRSRSKSGSAKKRLPLATTLGQSIMEKHGKTGGDGPRSVINKVPQSAIGSVPLPPGDKGSVPSVSQAAKAIPMPPQPSAASVRPPDPAPVETVKPPPQAPPTVTKPAASSVVMPIGAKPIVVPGRQAPLQPVGRVASVFLEKDDEPYDVPNSNRLPLPPPTSLATPDKLFPAPAGDKGKAHAPERALDKTPGVATVERPGHGRSQAPVEPNRGRSKEVAPGPVSKGSSADPRQVASSEKPVGRTPQSRSSGKEPAKSTAPVAPADRMPSRNQLPAGNRLPPARMPVNSEKITVKIVPSDRQVSVRGSSSSQPVPKAALRPVESYMNRGGPPTTKTDPSSKHRTKRASSTDSSRSTSGGRSRSSSSVSHDSEHLYSDIASPISSASSLSPIRSPAAKPRPPVQVEKTRIPPIKNSSGRLPAPPQASSAQYGMQRSSDGYRGGGGDQKGDRMPLSSSRPPQQSISSHMPSSRGAGRDIREGGGGRDAGGGGRDVGGGGRDVGGGGRDVSSREVSGRAIGSMGGVSHSRDAGMMESRMRSSSSSGHAVQGNFPSSRNLDIYPSQKISSEKSSSHLPMPPHSASNRSKRPASPIGRFSPPNKALRRAPEHKEPVKIPIPRHEKLTKLSSPPQRRRSDSSQVPLASPLGKGPTAIAAKHPPSSGAKPPPSSASTGGGNASKRKGAMSRREELLMQLQAVEDAIAKKRSKMQ